MNLGPYELNDIYCGDSAVMLAALPDACIDLTVTSPPYDSLRQYNGYAWDFDAIATQLYRVTKPGGVVVWVVGDETMDGDETGECFRQALGFKETGFNLHDTMIYAKANVGMYDPRNMRYKSAFEYMFVFSAGKPSTYNPIKDIPTSKPGRSLSRSNGRRLNGSLRKQQRPSITMGDYQDRSNIWEYFTGNNLTTKDKIAAKHPAIMSEALARDHIISWSNPGDIILDPFSGSGTTAKMAKMLQRQFIGFDISQEYVDLAKRRIVAAPVPLPFVMDEPVVKVEQVKLFCGL